MDCFSHGNMEHKWLVEDGKVIIVISLMQAPIKNALITETAATRCTILSLDTETGVITNLQPTHSPL